MAILMSNQSDQRARLSHKKPTGYTVLSGQVRALCYRSVLIGFVSRQKKVANHGVQSEGGRHIGRSSGGGGNYPYGIGCFYGTRIGKAHCGDPSFTYSDVPCRVWVPA